MHNIKKYKIFYSIFFPLIILLIGNLQAAGINDVDRNSGVYYGIPSLVNGSGGDTDAAAEEFNDFRFMVFPDGLESSGHPDYNNSYIITSNLHTGTNNTEIYGYVPIGGVLGENLTLSQISNRIYQWYNNYTPFIDGIFLDEFGYDYIVTRERQNKCVDWVHSYGLKVIANGWNPDHCLGMVDDPGFPNSTYNSNLEPTHISNGDAYCWENWVWSTTNGPDPAVWNDKDLWKNKTYKVIIYKEFLGIRAFTISVEEQNFNTFGSPASRVHEDFAFWCVLAAGFSNHQFSEYFFSSGNNQLYWYDKITNNIGTNYTSDLQEVTNGIFYRYTDTGIIRLDWNNHTGSFIPLAPDTNPPTFAISNFIPLSNENNVSFSVVVYLEIDDDRGVIKNSINAQIDGANAIVNGVFQSGYNGSESRIESDDAGGYNIYIDRTADYGTNTGINVVVWGEDGVNNAGTNTFAFITGGTNACISIDGDLSDWPGYMAWDVDSRTDIANDQSANIIRNYFFDGIDKAKSTNLYIAYIQNGSLNNNGNYGHQFYLDADNNSTTGNTSDVWWQTFGAEYFVEFYTLNDSLEYCEGVKKWTNSTWQNTGVMPVFGVSSNKFCI